MRTVYLIILTMSVFMLGAISHENDMANNCAKTGNASAWINDIQCEQAK